MKNFAIIISALLLTINLSAQEDANKLTTDVGLTFESRHYWRGIPVSSAPCFTGSLSVSKGGFTLGYWGGYAYDNTYSEFDIYGSYSIGNFTFSFIDLYVIGDETSLGAYHPDQKYWNLDRETTAHNIDLTASYVISDDFPLKVSYSTMVWGCDRDAEGDQRFSNYLELGYPIMNSDKGNLNAFFGMTLNDTEAVYGDGLGVVNMGLSSTKNIKVTDTFSLPITATLAMNPQKEIGFLVLSIGL